MADHMAENIMEKVYYTKIDNLTKIRKCKKDNL